jgi:poly(A) polymerase
MEVTKKPHLHQDWIDSHAFGIVKALQKGGFTTYLVGGCVRDLLLGIHPKDYDIATAAHPPQVKRLIYMAFIIGKRFRLVLVKRDDQQFEVATFRRESSAEEITENAAPAGDNVFGSPEEDAQRRDFTMNGLFYDPVNEQLIDYVNGLPDIEARVLRMIGDPDRRLEEDPIRTMRGIRLSHKLGFTIEPELRAAMMRKAPDLLRAVLPRRREEILKIMRLAEPELAIMELYDLDLLKYIAPTLHDLLSHDERRDLFFQFLQTFRGIVEDLADPTQIFAWLLYTILQTATSGPSERQTPITLEDEIFNILMRDEFGMYKLEQSAVVQAVDNLPHLQKVEDFKRRGERRQMTLMKNEGFKLSLGIARADFLLSPQELDFWQTAYGKRETEISSLETEAKAKRRRPRRRKPNAGAAKLEVDADADTDEREESATFEG